MTWKMLLGEEAVRAHPGSQGCGTAQPSPQAASVVPGGRRASRDAVQEGSGRVSWRAVL